MNKETRDFTILRPFDLEAAKAGDLVCWYTTCTKMRYVGPATSEDTNIGCFEFLEGPFKGTFDTYAAENLRMAPICWVEGRPVYKGDKLWHTGVRRVIEVDGEAPPSSVDATPCIKIKGHEDVGYYISFLTWNIPKTKKEGWINIYPADTVLYTASTGRYVYPNKETAEQNARNDIIACIHIEWEENTLT